jgi:WD40 repeat protein
MGQKLATSQGVAGQGVVAGQLKTGRGAAPLQPLHALRPRAPTASGDARGSEESELDLSTSTGSGVRAVTHYQCAEAPRPGSPKRKMLHRRLVSLDDDGQSLHVYDFGTGKLLRQLSTEGQMCLAAYELPDGRPVIASGSKDGALTLWDGAEFTPVYAQMVGHISHLHVYFTAEGEPRLVAAGMEDIKVLDGETGKLLRTLDGFNASVSRGASA